jgi:hypothetical protein
MTQHDRDRLQRNALVEQGSRHGVAEQMGTEDGRSNACTPQRSGRDLANGDPPQRTVGRNDADKDLIELEWLSKLFEIVQQRITDGLREWQPGLTTTLVAYLHGSAMPVDVIEAQSRHFAGPQP